MDKPSHADIWRKLDDLCGDIADIKAAIGSERFEGGKRVGDGLFGRVIATEAAASAYQADRNKILGAFASLVAVSALLILGVKEWIQSLFQPS